MTLTQLHNAINWEAIDAMHGDKKPSEDWLFRFRCALLDDAIHSKDREKMMAARSLLVPIWGQVVDIIGVDTDT